MSHSAVSVARVRAITTIGLEAARRDGLAGRMDRALDAVAVLADHDAVGLHAWDPVLLAHHPVAGRGYLPADVEDGSAGDIAGDAGFQIARRTRWPLRLRDVRGRRPRLERVLQLRRFSDGVTHCLFTADGRYTGVLNLNTIDGAPYDDEHLTALALAAPLLAELVDMTATLQSAAAILPAAMPAAVLRRDGTVAMLPGQPMPRLLGPGHPVLRLARQRAPADPGTAAFLVDVPGAGLTRVVVVRPAGGDGDGALLVGLEPAAPPLSRRELDVLALLVEGRTNPDIAARLHVSRHTVGTHIAHILEGLGVSTRSAAAARAVRDGLVLVG